MRIRSRLIEARPSAGRSRLARLVARGVGLALLASLLLPPGTGLAWSRGRSPAAQTSNGASGHQDTKERDRPLRIVFHPRHSLARDAADPAAHPASLDPVRGVGGELAGLLRCDPSAAPLTNISKMVTRAVTSSAGIGWLFVASSDAAPLKLRVAVVPRFAPSRFALSFTWRGHW